ncbi:UvrD-helicase domain-containing protein [Burkholderia ubonensis]|uniref:UvrD-helicase domain-containing protein n=1 Tax=Burkholderia ubonensis TaxID=101571 RepID=UPI001E2EC46F|nr:UvrD-helicase domain-containing protein [Burkholderia ubonensis]
MSTIHSFYWTIVKSFQADIQRWVASRLEEKLAELKDKAANFSARVQQRTRDKNARDTARCEGQLAELHSVKSFSYGVGSDYGKGVLGHDDVIKLTNFLLQNRPLFRQLVAMRFPFVFIDESQDTMVEVVQSFKAVEQQMRGSFCLGFFGDPMQKIYLSGAGSIAAEADWREIDKPENYRCSMSVLDVANAVRSGGDALVQERGRREVVDGEERPVVGSAQFFVLPTSMERDKALDQVRAWMATKGRDAHWDSTDPDTVKVLVIVHRMAANRLGFGGLYSALNDGAPDWLKQGFQEGTAWPLKPFLSSALPLVDAVNGGDEFGVMALLRAQSPRFKQDALATADVPKMLAEVRAAVLRLAAMSKDSNVTIRAVLNHLNAHGLCAFDDKYLRHLEAVDGDAAADQEAGDGDALVLTPFLACSAPELFAYRTYLNDRSAFATQHGVKGAEFERVMVVLDDAESDFNLYSYEKYFGIAELSDRDNDNITRGQDNVLDRTRRLLYVCCTRAKRDLALVLFTEDPGTAKECIKAAKVVGDDCVRDSADLAANAAVAGAAP